MDEPQLHLSVGSAATNFHVSTDVDYSTKEEDIAKIVSKMLHVMEYGNNARKGLNMR